jgi:acyl-coenzyme A thioesterase PaaI-like protein
MATDTAFVSFRVSPESLQQQLHQFNARGEVQWFGFVGAFHSPASAVVTLKTTDSGVLGGGGTNALNGGVIAAGFDAAFVLAGLAQYDSAVVVTLELSVQFLSLAMVTEPLAFTAGVTRSSRRFSYVRGVLAPVGTKSGSAFASATGMVAPAN